MVAMSQKMLRNSCFEGFFDGQWCFPRGKTGSICDTKDMGVDSNAGFSPIHLEHNVCRFAPDSWQGLKRVSVARNLAVMLLNQNLGRCDDIFCFAVVKPNGFDEAFQLFFAERQHLLRCCDFLKQSGGCLVNADIGRLGGERDSHQQCVDVFIIQLALGLWLNSVKSCEHRFNLRRLKFALSWRNGRGWLVNIHGNDIACLVMADHHRHVEKSADANSKGPDEWFALAAEPSIVVKK